jgi:hypothetical protein
MITLSNEAELFSFMQGYYPDLKRAEDQYSHFDCFTNQHGLYIELKSRRTHYDQLLIEKVKYERLISITESAGLLPIYICSTPKGVWGWNLLKVKPAWEIALMPETTDFEATDKIAKKIGYLNIAEGEWLK